MNRQSIRQDLRIATILLFKFTLRHWLAARWSYLLILIIVAVGVASLNGIRQASRAATANFGLFNEAVSGRSDFLIQASVGAMQTKQLFELSELSHSSDWHLFPVIEGSLKQLDETGAPLRQLRLIGLDLLSVANLPRFIEQGFRIGDDMDEWYDWVGSSNKVWVSADFLETANLKIGDALKASAAGKVHHLQIAGAFGNEQNPVPEYLVIADLPVVQSVLGRAEEVDRVEVIVNNRKYAMDPDKLDVFEKRLNAQLSDGLVLQPAAERAVERAAMTQAFRLNLMILSLIAMLVGAYLILQALDAAVVRRRSELAVLKSLGASKRAVLFSLLFEAASIGLLGSIIGIGLGLMLAAGTVQILANTVNALYFATSVESIRLETSDLLVGSLTGTVLSLLAGWLPARDAMLTPPAQILARGDWSPGFKWLHNRWTGIVSILLGMIALSIPAPIMAGGGRIPVGGFMAAGCWIFSAAVLSGEVMVFLNGWLQRFRLGPVSLLATSRLAEGSSRHRLAVAGLVVAVSMVTGILQMVGSFRSTIEQWFDVRFQADLYISERGSTGADSQNGIEPEIIEALVSNDSVDYADTLYTAYVNASRGQTVLAGIDFELWHSAIEQIWQTPPREMIPVEGAQQAFVSEAFARRFDVLQGGVVTLETPAGPKQITPVGIYSDYGNEFGTAAIDQSIWRKWTGMDRPINTSLFLKSGVEPDALSEVLQLEYPGLDIRNAKELREVVLTIFDQTFRVTFALNVIGIVVAIAGLVLGLLAIFAESSSTWRTLSHLGFHSRGFMLVAGIEGAGIALGAWLSGTLVGLVIGWLLIYVINVQSFGWTLVWNLPVTSLLLFGFALIACGYVCGVLTGAWWHRYK